jgi:transglutaminase-like putative cysteine protease
MTLLKPLPLSVTRPISYLLVAAWVVSMGVLVNRTYLQASPVNLATDLARYGPTATWRGVYYRGEKVGFTVGQTIRTADGFELQEDGRLQMSMLGATTFAAIHTTARVDSTFALRSFDFSLDPGTGSITIRGSIQGTTSGTGPYRLALEIKSRGGNVRTEQFELAEAPVMTLNLSRILANGGLTPGARHRWTVFDPATLRNAPVEIRIGDREVVRTGDGSVPAFRTEMAFAGLETTSWITDTGEVVREESPLGLMTVRESQQRAQGLAIPARVQADLLRASAVVPAMRQRIDEPRDVKLLRISLEGADLSPFELDGVGQEVDGNVIEIRDPRMLEAEPTDPDVERFLHPEVFLESDAPEIVAEAELAVRGIEGTRARAERLVRHVNALLDKKPTVSLPSARDVLRTRVGDCNEHTALYVAMARALGIPARISVGLTYVRGVQGAFYYHAWPEVYLSEEAGRGYWLPVDPTLNQFPADATHVRLARGGLDKQAAILPLIGRLKMTVLDMELAPNAIPILVGGQQQAGAAPPVLNLPRSQTGPCRCDSQ